MQFESKKEYVAKLLGEEDTIFIIPDYQRPYSWGQDECEQLWTDIVNVFGDGENIDEYFLGSIVTYKNDQKLLEIIDGQQRITTLTLLFRAFYEHFKNEGKNVKQGYLNGFGRCIWKFDSADEELYFDEMHLRSEVEFDDNKEEFAKLLSQDIENLGDLKSKYVKNYTFFYDKIASFKQNTATQWEPFCKMLLGKKLFVLFITCDSQESAMTIFNTLNSRGMPLSNADILKGYIYKHKKTDKDKKEFAQSWKNLYSKVDDDKEIKSLDFLFLQFMHIIRAQHEDFDTTTQSVLNFFTKKDKKVYYGAFGNWLYKDETMPFILHLADFWLNPQDYLSRKSTNYLKILNLFSK